MRVRILAYRWTVAGQLHFLIAVQPEALLKCCFSCFELLSLCPAFLHMVDAGTNCGYVEELQHIAGLEHGAGCMCINTEWSSFGKLGELNDITTEFDLQMDKQSMDRGKNM